MARISTDPDGQTLIGRPRRQTAVTGDDEQITEPRYGVSTREHKNRLFIVTVEADLPQGIADVSLVAVGGFDTVDGAVAKYVTLYFYQLNLLPLSHLIHI